MQTYQCDSLKSLQADVGKELALSEWFPIGQERVNRFAEVTEDLQWIHVDTERAERESPYGGTIAHGYLTLALLPRLTNACIQLPPSRMAVNYGLNRVRFMAPVRVGQRIRARYTLQSCELVPGGYQVVWKATLECEGSEKPVCVAEMVARRFS